VIGAAIFGRDVDYDTNQDAVVRNAAAEVRKRLAQYYDDSDGSGRFRIDLPAGAYLPKFLPPAVSEQPQAAPRPTAAISWRLLLWALASLVALTTVLVAGRWWWLHSQQADLARFWAPLLNDGETVQICVGQPAGLFSLLVPRQKELAQLQASGQDPLIRVSELLRVEKYFLYVGDALSMTNIAAYINANGGKYRFRGGAVTPYSELRGSPVVLIANHDWTVQLTGHLRFYFSGRAVLDRQRNDVVVGSTTAPATADDAEDYAIVTRMQQPSTERTIICAAGLSHKGTLAAGEFVVNPGYMRDAVRNAPRDWYRKNVQFVLKVKIVGGTPGPPNVVAMHFW